MMFRRKLACSFCRRGAADVAKLVAGPRVYICDRCAVEVLRIMENSTDSQAGPAPAHHRLFRSLRDRLDRLWHGDASRLEAQVPEARHVS